MIGRLLQFAWTVGAVFFLIVWFVGPVALAYWRKREREDAAETERVLGTLGFDRSHAYEMDAM